MAVRAGMEADKQEGLQEWSTRNAGDVAAVGAVTTVRMQMYCEGRGVTTCRGTGHRVTGREGTGQHIRPEQLVSRVTFTEMTQVHGLGQEPGLTLV